jgi:hypothetical protein
MVASKGFRQEAGVKLHFRQAVFGLKPHFAPAFVGGACATSPPQWVSKLDPLFVQTSQAHSRAGQAGREPGGPPHYETQLVSVGGANFFATSDSGGSENRAATSV